MAMHEPQDHTKRPRTEANDSFNSIRELLSQQHQQLERTICEQLTSHKLEISKELGEVNARMETLEQRVTKLETPTPLSIGQAQPQQPAAAVAAPTPPFQDPCQVVMGGWPDSTKKSDLLEAAQQLLLDKRSS